MSDKCNCGFDNWPLPCKSENPPNERAESSFAAPTGLGVHGPMTPERHRRYVQRYITEATPFTRAMCELEMLMPSTYVQQADGSLQKTHDLWPQWAKDHWRTLNEICEEIQKRAARDS